MAQSASRHGVGLNVEYLWQWELHGSCHGHQRRGDAAMLVASPDVHYSPFSFLKYS